MSFRDRARRGLRGLAKSGLLIANRLRFQLFFKNQPGDGEYCNSKRIRCFKRPADDGPSRPYLVIIRCGTSHCLVDDRSERNFDIAVNPYARPDERVLASCEYAYTGGANKFKAARQFIDDALLATYRGFMFLDDDLETTYSELTRFLDYCAARSFALAQPSLTPDSHYSHSYLRNASRSGWRSVALVEVMCPYFSSDALRVALNTFDLSYSTWGLDLVWPRVLNVEPVVVDEFAIKHTRPAARSDGAFYAYLRRIGISPEREQERLKHLSDAKIRALTRTRPRR